MRIDRSKLDLAMANACKSIVDFRGELSSATLAKIRNDPEYDVNPKIVGKLARALSVPVEYLLREES